MAFLPLTGNRLLVASCTMNTQWTMFENSRNICCMLTISSSEPLSTTSLRVNQGMVCADSRTSRAIVRTGSLACVRFTYRSKR